MKKLFDLPVMVKKARDAHEGKNIVIEILIFLAVMLVGSFAEGAVIVPFTFFGCFQNPEFLKASMNADYDEVARISNELASQPLMKIGNLVATLGMILVVILFVKKIQKRSLDTAGYIKKNALKEYGIGLFIGFGMFFLAILPCLLTGAVKLESGIMDLSVGFIVLVFLGYLIQGMSEELMCRGYFLVSIARKYPVVVAILVNSVAFSCLHLYNPNVTPLAILNLTLFGIFMSVYFIKRGSIWGAAAIHSMWNFAQGNIFGVKVSGLNSGNSLFNAISNPSLSILNGGEFGIEGGICTTIVEIIGILIVVFYVKQVEVYQEVTVNQEVAADQEDTAE